MALSPVVQDLTSSVPNVILLIDGADGTQLHPCFAQYPMLRHHIPTQVATPRCWPVRMPGLEPLSASRFVQPLLLTVARRTQTLTWHAQFLSSAPRKFKLFLQLYYCILGFARGRDESAQDNSSSKQQARPFQPTLPPTKVLKKAWHGKTARIERWMET